MDDQLVGYLEDQIIEHLKQNGMTYIAIPSAHVKTIYRLLFENVVDEVADDTVLLYHGAHFRIQGDFDKMIKYYLMAVEYGNTVAMFNLAKHYEKQNDEPNAIKYYLMGVGHGDIEAMMHLAYQFEAVGDNANALKYYSMAFDHGCNRVVDKVLHYYRAANDSSNMIKYWKIAVDRELRCMKDTFGYCLKNNLVDAGIELAEKEMNKEINDDIVDFIIQVIARWHTSDKIVNLIIAIDLTKCESIVVTPMFMMLKNALTVKVDLMKLHFAYAPGGEGYDRALNDFAQKII